MDFGRRECIVFVCIKSDKYNICNKSETVVDDVVRTWSSQEQTMRSICPLPSSAGPAAVRAVCRTCGSFSAILHWWIEGLLTWWHTSQAFRLVLAIIICGKPANCDWCINTRGIVIDWLIPFCVAWVVKCSSIVSEYYCTSTDWCITKCSFCCNWSAVAFFFIIHSSGTNLFIMKFSLL